MDTREAIVFRIQQLCKERGLTPNGLSNLAAVPQTTVKSILKMGKAETREPLQSKSCVMVWRSPWGSSFSRRSLMHWSRRLNDPADAKVYCQL